MDALAPRRVRTEGTAEATWLGWAGLAAVPSAPLDAYLRADDRLIVVAPHPDDEVLACGGLMSMHAKRGGISLVVSVTDGEASHSAEADAALGRKRQAERQAGLAALGVAPSSVISLGLPDGRVTASGDDLLGSLIDLLRPTDVVVSTWRLDGHPDHEATGASTAAACASVGCRLFEAPVWMWNWAQPDDVRVPWERLTGLRLTPAACTRKRLALSAHTSQLLPRSESLGPVLGDEMVQRASRVDEYFFASRAHGSMPG